MGLLTYAASLGVGAFLGTLIFIMYRIDRKASETRLSGLLEEAQKIRKEEQEIRGKNTEALTELITLIRRVNGRLK